MIKKALILVLISSLSLLGCTPKPDNPTPPKTPNKEALTKTEDAKKVTSQSKKATPASLTLTLKSIVDQSPIPAMHAFCVEDGKGKGTFGDNVSPQIQWSAGPEGTKSYAIILHDPDVPSKADDVNQEGKTVSNTLPRVDFFHWILVNIPSTVTELAEGAEGNAVTPRGKKPGQAKSGLRGVNNYTQWFASNEKMKGAYGGYDGPCPPWNDERVHHYHFTVYALDVPSLDLKAGFNGPDALKAMEGHILAKGQRVGLYKLNTKVAYP